MRFSPKLDQELVAQLRCQGSTPPRSVVGALLSFGDLGPVLTYRVAEDKEAGTRPGWLCVARANGGVLIVEASSTDPFWTWSEDYDRERDDRVHADWFPLSKVRSVALGVAEYWRGPVISDLDDVNVRGEWTITIEGRDSPLVLDRAPGENQSFEVVENFCAGLLESI